MSLPIPTRNQVEAELCRRSFKFFVRTFWESVPGAGKIIWGWHMDVLCQELQKEAFRVKAGLPREYDLIINIIPGSSKSTLCSIMFQPWTWTFMPEARHLCVSHTQNLVLDLSNKSRYLVLSEKYQRLFPQVAIRSDQGSKGDYANEQGGDRYSATVGGMSPMGRHFHFIVTDDPIDPQKAGQVSGLELKAAGMVITEVLPSRTTNQANVSRILIMQRLHELDPTGVWFEKSRKPDGPKIRHICLPGELTGIKDNVQPPELKERYIEGLLCPERFPMNVLKGLKVMLGPYAYAGQFLQMPVPPEGGMFKERWFTQRQPAAPYQASRVIFVDPAASHAQGCYTAMTLMSYKDGMLYVENVRRGQWGPEERDLEILAYAKAARLRYGPNFAPRIYIEDQGAAAGKTFHKHLCKILAGFPVFSFDPLGPKEIRAEPFAGQAAAGNVTLIEDGNWDIAAWLHELTSFPLGALADQVDSASGACAVLTTMMSAGTVRFLHLGQNKNKAKVRIVVCSKEDLARLVVEEHRCVLVSISDPAVDLQSLPGHGIVKLLESVQLRFADLDPADKQDSWEKPLEGLDKLPGEAILSREEGKKLWATLCRKRSEPFDVLVFQDEGRADRRAFSVALAVCDIMYLPRESTIWFPNDPDRKVVKADMASNPFVYEQVKATRSLVI